MSATTDLPALSQAYPEAIGENSCSYFVSPSACVSNGRIALSGHDCQHSFPYIASPTKAFPRIGMSLACLPHQENRSRRMARPECGLWYQAFLSRVRFRSTPILQIYEEGR